MSAPLPQGFQTQVMPQAPRMDPNVFAPDAEKTLRVAHSGLLLGQELANLQNKRAERELQAAKIAADSAKLKYEMRLIEDAELRLPDVHKAALARLEQERATADLARVEAQALMSVNLPDTRARLASSEASNALLGSQAVGALGVPWILAAGTAWNAENALNTAQANNTSGFSSLNTPGQVQATTAAQTRGSWGVSEGNLPDGEVPYQYRQTQILPDVDGKTGNTVQRAITIDTRNGQVISKGDVINTTKLGVDEPSVKAARDAIAQVVQARDMARALKDSIETFKKEHPTWISQVRQGAATVFANKSPQSVVGLAQSFAGGKLQSSQATDLAARAAALQNFYTKMVAGSAVTVDEASRLQPLVVNPGDMSDPKRMLEKLKGFEGLLDAKIQPFVISGVAAKSGMMPDQPPAAPAAPAAQGSAQPKDLRRIMEALRRGEIREYDGVPVKLGTLPNGRPGLVPAQ